MADTIAERLIVGVKYALDKGSESGVLSSFRGVITGAGAVSAAVIGAGAAFAAMAVDQAAADDEVTKTAHSLGMLTDAFTANSYAMGREGVGHQEYSAGLRTLQTQLEGAARESGEALPWLKRFGIEAKDSAGGVRLAADVMAELEQHMGSLSDGDLRGASLKLFGESGLKMGTALAKGADNMQALRDRARELGAVLDEEAGANAEKLTDSMTDLSGAVGGLRARVSRSLTPALTPLVDGLTDWLVESELVESATTKLTDAAVWAFEGLQTPAGQAVAAVLGLTAVIGTASAGASLMGAIGGAVPVLGAMGAAVGAAAVPMAATAAAVLGLVLVIDDLYTAAQGGDSALMHLAESMGYATEAQNALSTSVEKGNDAIDMGSALWEAAAATGSILSAMLYNAATGAVWLTDKFSPLIDVAKTLLGLNWETNPLAWWFDQATSSITGALAAVTDFKAAASGFGKLAAYINGSEDVAFNEQAMNEPIRQTGGAIRLAGYNPEIFTAGIEMARANNIQARGSSAPAVNVTVDATLGASPAEVGRIAGAEITRQLTSAQAIVGGG